MKKDYTLLSWKTPETEQSSIELMHKLDPKQHRLKDEWPVLDVYAYMYLNLTRRVIQTRPLKTGVEDVKVMLFIKGVWRKCDWTNSRLHLAYHTANSYQFSDLPLPSFLAVFNTVPRRRKVDGGFCSSVIGTAASDIFMQCINAVVDLFRIDEIFNYPLTFSSA